MAQSQRQLSIIDKIRDLGNRITTLERSESVPPSYTDADRPAASTAPALIIFNTTTSKHQASNGATWSDLY